MSTLTNAAGSSTIRTPVLCVDLDGTLIRTDLLFESLALLARYHTWALFLVPFWLLRGKAHMKREIASRVSLNASTLPYREDLLAWLKVQRESGRQLHLVTGSDAILAEAVAAHLGIFDSCMGSDGAVNLTSHRKAERLSRQFGARQFDYAGDSSADIAVWAAARHTVLAGKAAGRRPPAQATVEAQFPDRGSRAKAIVKALRIRHWVKNVLVFVPVITSHQWLNPAAWLHATIAFFSFSLIASGVYLLNDLLDLEADRVHPVKKNRPFASGALAVSLGLMICPLMFLSGFALSVLLPVGAQFWLVSYAILTCLYSFYLKRKLLVDVFTLALLYTVRIVTGAAATGFAASPWLLAFSIFIFLSLAFLKRASELIALARAESTTTAGRSYFTWDLLQVNVFGAMSGGLASLVLALYVHSDAVRMLYRNPAWLWLLVPALLYWICRAWMLTHRGAMNEDPILFATHDRVTILLGVLCFGLLLLATFSKVGVPGIAM